MAAGEGTIEVAVQGLTDNQRHEVSVSLNGATLGEIHFFGQVRAKGTFGIPDGVLLNGANNITLTSEMGTTDVSLVDYIDVSFPHTLTADSDVLKFTASAGQTVTVAGFVNPPARLIDITNPLQPVLMNFHSAQANNSYSLSAEVSWSSSGEHTLLAISNTQIGVPAALAQHQPSRLHAVQPGAQLVVLTSPQFIAELQPLVALHQTQGASVALLNVDSIYDEFNFGERTPYAIRHFLRAGIDAWKTKPHYLLLAGDASVDPRNYLGFGLLDFVPTKIIATSELKTASDDWFSDFTNTGFATIATGRLPARTAMDMQTMVSKILSYAAGSSASWTNQAMMVADFDDPSISFANEASSIQKALPSTITVNDVFAGALGTSAARQNVLAGINSGQLLVNYTGHGSIEIWSGSDLFDDTVAASLSNGSKLPMFVIMNCLNGFFHDVYTESLATSLMLSPNGGAVAVWASSGLTAPDPQFQMDRTLLQTLFARPGIGIGDAVLAAKSGIGDEDVRRTFILFGDPAISLKQPGGVGATE
jgi:hypothetical protein